MSRVRPLFLCSCLSGTNTIFDSPDEVSKICKPESKWEKAQVSVEDRLEDIYKSDKKLWEKVKRQECGLVARGERKKWMGEKALNFLEDPYAEARLLHE